MLENIKNTNPFTVPEGYFEQLHSQLEAKIKQQEQEKRTAIRVSFFQKAKPYLMAAAMFGVLFTVLQTVVQPFDVNSNKAITVAEFANSNVMESDLMYSQIMTDEYSFWEFIGNE